jgi:hypothetical protein
VFQPLKTLFHTAICAFGEVTMKKSDHFRKSAESAAKLAERATEEATQDRYKRMEAAWLALAREQDWLDGEAPLASSEGARKTPPSGGGANVLDLRSRRERRPD